MLPWEVWKLGRALWAELSSSGGAGVCVGVRTDPQPRAMGQGRTGVAEGMYQCAAPWSGPLRLTMRESASLGDGTLAGCWIQVLVAVFPTLGAGAPGLLTLQCLLSPVADLHRDPGLPCIHATMLTSGLRGYAMCGLNPGSPSRPISSLLGHL